MRVYLDPGHGGQDRGGRGLGLDEANLNLAIALAAAERLRAAGVEVRMSRSGDQVPGKDAKAELIRRTSEANGWGAHAYVSIHNNSGGAGRVSGVETYVQQANAASQDLGRRIQAALVAATGLPDRGVRTRDLDDGRIYPLGANPDVDRDYYHVLRESRMPAVIAECGYMDHPADAALLRQATVLRRLGEAIAEAVLEWGRARGLVAPPPAPQPDWRAQAIAEARAVGLLANDHPPEEHALVAHVAAVAVRLYRRIEELERKVKELQGGR